MVGQVKGHRHLLTDLCCVAVVAPCAGAGAAVRPAADRDVSGAAEAHHLRGVHRRALHTRTAAGQGLHAEDGGLQPPHTVSCLPPPHPPSPPYSTGIAVAPPPRPGTLTAATDVSFKGNPGGEEEEEGGGRTPPSHGGLFLSLPC